MVNARAHLVGKDGENKILNIDFRRTYDNFLNTLIYKKIVKKEMSSSDKMIFVYYLQL